MGEADEFAPEPETQKSTANIACQLVNTITSIPWLPKISDRPVVMDIIRSAKSAGMSHEQIDLASRFFLLALQAHVEVDKLLRDGFLLNDAFVLAGFHMRWIVTDALYSPDGVFFKTRDLDMVLDLVVGVFKNHAKSFVVRANGGYFL